MFEQHSDVIKVQINIFLIVALAWETPSRPSWPSLDATSLEKLSKNHSAREISLVLCVYLEGWEGDARGRTYGDICICIADSLCYTAETNTPL